MRNSEFSYKYLIVVVTYLTLTSLTRSEYVQVNHDCCSKSAEYDNNTSLCSDGNDIKLNCSFAYIDLPNYHLNNGLSNEEDLIIRSVSDVKRLLTHNMFCLVQKEQNVSTVFVCESEISKITLENEIVDKNADQEYFSWKFYLYTSLMAISGVFCILTVLTYASFSELWNVQDKLLMYTTFSLLVLIMSFNMVHLNPYLIEYHHFCIIIAFLLYYFTMTTYFWLNIIGFNIWRQIWFKKFCMREHHLLVIYNFIGWGSPSCFLIVALITNHTQGSHLKPSFGQRSCWFSDLSEIWTYCTGPIAVLLTINMVYIVLSSWKLCTNHNQFEQLRLKTLRYRRTMYLKLVLILGSDWICEVLYSMFSSQYLSIPLEMINALQGVFIFFVLVVCRTKVKKILAIKKPCGFKFPKSWTEQPDDEYDTLLLNAMESMITQNHWTFFMY